MLCLDCIWVQSWKILVSPCPLFISLVSLSCVMVGAKRQNCHSNFPERSGVKVCSLQLLRKSSLAYSRTRKQLSGFLNYICDWNLFNWFLEISVFHLPLRTKGILHVWWLFPCSRYKYPTLQKTIKPHSTILHT